MTAVATIPQTLGEWTPAEAKAWREAQFLEGNLAKYEKWRASALRYVTNIHTEWLERVRNLQRRWRAVYHMLAGNTLERGGPSDIHVPEIYKAVETLVPRLEEVMLDQDPFFRIVPRRKKDEEQAEAMAAFIEWQYNQAKIPELIQPALRDMLITQAAIMHSRWDDRIRERMVRRVERDFDKDGNLKRKVFLKMKKVVDYSGPVTDLVDPFDFIIDTKATDPQKAVFIGHRMWMTIDEVRRIGDQLGWVNLDELEKEQTNATLYGAENDYYRWPRDATARYGNYLDQTGIHKNDERPEKVEVITLYSRWSTDDGVGYADYRMTIVGGRVCVELRKNPHDGELRPYAVFRDVKSGHEFYGTGPFDNAVRINQHLDRYHQIFLRAAEVAACPMVFAEEDSDMPDSLFKVRPFSVFKGVGAVRFTQVPDGSLRAAPLVLGTLQRNLEETVGAFRLNMGQDSDGTATEASLSLQEGNRRNRGHVRAFASGLEQLLHIYHQLNLQYSVEDVEFPVLGKRAADMQRTHLNVGPADLLDEVQFELVGLKNARNYGMRQTGLMAVLNAGMPLIAGNPQAADQIYLLHSLIKEFMGIEEADRTVHLPTPLHRLKSQDQENEGLIQGAEIEVDESDDDQEHLSNPTFQALKARALDEDAKLPFHVRKVILEHWFNHVMQLRQKQAQEGARQARMPGGELPPEIMPGQGEGAPPPGGMSNGMQALAGNGSPGGQIGGENPGPADTGKYGPGSRRGRTVNQTENNLTP